MAKKDTDFLDKYLSRNPAKKRKIVAGEKASLILKGEGLAAWERLNGAEKVRWVEKTQAASASKDGNKLGKKKAAAQDKSTKVPKREATKTPTREATKAPARTATKAPTRKATKAPVKKATKAPSRKATKVPTRKPSTPVRNLVRPTAKGASGEQGMLDFTPKTTTNLPEEDDLGRSIRKSKEAANKPPVKGASGRQMTFGFADDAALPVLRQLGQRGV